MNSRSIESEYVNTSVQQSFRISKNVIFIQNWSKAIILISNRTILEAKCNVKQDERYFSTSGGHIEVIFGPVHIFTLPRKCADLEKKLIRRKIFEKMVYFDENW